MIVQSVCEEFYFKMHMLVHSSVIVHSVCEEFDLNMHMLVHSFMIVHNVCDEFYTRCTIIELCTSIYICK